MELNVLPPEQRLYTYAQSQQISMQTGLIGHLRMDFGSEDKGFYSTWFDFRKELNDPDFKMALGIVINHLREEGGLLNSRASMAQVCRSTPDSGFSGNYTTEYGFRVDSAHHAFLLRLNPNKGDYNAYCYCYRRDWLDRHLQQAEKGIRFITSGYQNLFRLQDGDKVRISYPDGTAQDQTARFIDEYHLELGANLYHICELAERMERAGATLIPLRSSLPDQCYSSLPSTGEVVILKKGETGYYKTGIITESREEALAIVEDYNRKAGVTKAQEQAMQAGSMFGFGKPAADPKNYDSAGQPLKTRPNRSPER